MSDSQRRNNDGEAAKNKNNNNNTSEDAFDLSSVAAKWLSMTTIQGGDETGGDVGDTKNNNEATVRAKNTSTSNSHISNNHPPPPLMDLFAPPPPRQNTTSSNTAAAAAFEPPMPHRSRMTSGTPNVSQSSASLATVLASNNQQHAPSLEGLHIQEIHVPDTIGEASVYSSSDRASIGTHVSTDRASLGGGASAALRPPVAPFSQQGPRLFPTTHADNTTSRHNRTLSWNGNNGDLFSQQHQQQYASHHQDDTMSLHSRSRRRANTSTFEPTARVSRHTRNSTVTSGIPPLMDTILHAGPYETEAETYILKAIEKQQQQQNRMRFHTIDSTSVWSAADQAQHGFLLQDDAAAAVNVNTSRLSPVTLELPPMENLQDQMQMPLPPLQPQTQQQQQHQNVVILDMPQPMTRSASTAANTSQTRETTQQQPPSQQQQQQQARPLLPRPVKRPPPQNKRQISVQDHLHGLTYAMQALEGNNNNNSEGFYNSGNEADDNKEKTPFLPTHETTAAAVTATLTNNHHGAADQFAKHAARVMDEEHSESTDSNDNGTVKKGHKRWNTLDSLSMLQESQNNNNNEDEDHASDLSPVSTSDDGDDDVNVAAMDGATENGDQFNSNNNNSNNNNMSPGSMDYNKRKNNNKKNSDQSNNKRRLRRNSVLMQTNSAIKENLAIWRTFLSLRRRNAFKYTKHALIYVILPATALSAILFYVADNPPTGNNAASSKASASWWVLFIGVRQVITFFLSLVTQAIVIDFLGLDSKIMLKILGPVLSLLIVQSKGWPFIVSFWAVYDFILLQGDWPLAHHWGYFQTQVGLFNAENPSGNIVDSHWNRVILGTAIGVSTVTAVKRFIIGLYQGRQLFTQYGQQLAKVMNKMLLISQVAGLAQDIERAAHAPDPNNMFTWNEEALRGLTFTDFEIDDDSVSKTAENPGLLNGTEAHKLQQLLDEWEEPDVDMQNDNEEDVTISAVLKFRKALFFIQKDYAFSYAFGPASSREDCVASAQAVYDRLLLHKPERECLHFETIALLAVDAKGRVNQEKARQLIKLFRPDRDGRLSLVDFVKSIDAVYKRYRLLLASIANTTTIDRAFERIFNFVYYVVVLIIVTSVWGFDPLALFLSLSSVLVGLAFMIGRTASTYFEGVMFILIRRPYGIGDRIHVSNIEMETDINGSFGWVVENITLAETTAVWTPTRERCSLANGSLSQSRIINGARSPQAQFMIPFKFPIKTPYSKILIFKTAVEEYLKARPREWLAMTGFRALHIAPELGYIEYMMHVQHRESWQQFTQLQDSRANFCSYCLEVSFQLGMHYSAPPLPVDLRYSEQAAPRQEESVTDYDIDSATRLEGFRSLAMTQHNIGWIGK